LDIVSFGFFHKLEHFYNIIIAERSK